MYLIKLIEKYVPDGGAFSDTRTLLEYSVILYALEGTKSGTPIASNRRILPASFQLSSYPNPFNAQMSIEFTLPEQGVVELLVYDILGKKIVELEHGFLQAGHNRQQWNGRNKFDQPLPSGIYFIQLNNRQGEIFTRRILK